MHGSRNKPGPSCSVFLLSFLCFSSCLSSFGHSFVSSNRVPHPFLYHVNTMFSSFVFSFVDSRALFILIFLWNYCRVTMKIWVYHIFLCVREYIRGCSRLSPRSSLSLDVSLSSLDDIALDIISLRLLLVFVRLFPFFFAICKPASDPLLERENGDDREGHRIDTSKSHFVLRSSFSLSPRLSRIYIFD